MACATGLLYPSVGVLMVTDSMVQLPRPAYLAITLTAALFLQIIQDLSQATINSTLHLCSDRHLPKS